MQELYNVKIFGKNIFYGRLHPFPKRLAYAGGRIFRARGGSPRKCRNLAGIPGENLEISVVKKIPKFLVVKKISKFWW